MLAVALGFLAAPSACAAQTVVLRGEGTVLDDQRLQRLLREGAYTTLSTDTVLGRADTIPGDLLVLDSRVAIEGVVTGDLVGVDADLFLRPSARVLGDVVNLGGGLYPSELAHVAGEVHDRPLAPYTVSREDELLVIVGRRADQDLVLDGVFGFHVPRYNRVDGLAVDWGATYRVLRLGRTEAFLHGQAGYRTERGAFAWGGSLLLERAAWQLEGGAERRTASNDRWIRGTLRNSADFLWDGDDMRNYYETTTVFGELRRRLRAEDSPRQVWLGLRVQHEDAETLEAGSPWTLLGDEPLRFNPPVNPGGLFGVIPWSEAEWLTPRTAFEGRLEVEYGQPWEDPAVVGPGPLPAASFDDFWRLRASAEWAMLALRDHTLEIEAQLFLPLGGDDVRPLPRQRWGMLGGSSTLRTLDDGEMLGDHLAYVETEYIIPFPAAWRLPYLGLPELQLLHMAGSAWTGDRDADFVQNVGARIEVFAFFARYLIDPASDESEFSVGVSWPFDSGYPWQSGGGAGGLGGLQGLF